jgi:hypothetical protein
MAWRAGAKPDHRTAATPTTGPARTHAVLALFLLALAPAQARAQANSPSPLRIGRFTLAGFLQADYRATFDAERDESDPGFLLRRVRVSLTGEIAPKLSIYVSGDLTGTPVARDVYATFSAIPGASIRAGQFNAPFSLERLTSSQRLEVIDRTVVADQLTPSRDLGVMVFNPAPFFGWLSYQAAVINGTGANLRDNNDAKDVVGRVVVAVPAVRGLSVGGNGNAGTQPDGRRTRVGADVNYDTKSYRAALEIVRQSLDGPIDRVATGLILLGAWKRPAAQPTEYYAGYELAARFLDVDDDAGTLTAREIQFGGSYFVSAHVKISSNLIVPIGDDQPQTHTRWWSRLQVAF